MASPNQCCEHCLIRVSKKARRKFVIFLKRSKKFIGKPGPKHEDIVSSIEELEARTLDIEQLLHGNPQLSAPKA